MLEETGKLGPNLNRPHAGPCIHEHVVSAIAVRFELCKVVYDSAIGLLYDHKTSSLAGVNPTRAYINFLFALIRDESLGPLPVESIKTFLLFTCAWTKQLQFTTFPQPLLNP